MAAVATSVEDIASDHVFRRKSYVNETVSFDAESVLKHGCR
jgi:hypothetical protein